MPPDTASTRHVTRLLEQARHGDGAALDQVFHAVYDELRLLARRQLGRWHGDPSVNATALVHEAYLKLVGRTPLDLAERGHFFALAARAMRQILSNHARDRKALKRGGESPVVTLDEGLAGGAPAPERGAAETLIELDRALTQLEATHARAARVVECRFFGGMTVDETAAALGVSDRTVKRDWDFAQAWLRTRLGGGG
jgi:RNA polymerase sigma factor (TIGR02999 family)